MTVSLDGIDRSEKVMCTMTPSRSRLRRVSSAVLGIVIACSLSPFAVAEDTASLSTVEILLRLYDTAHGLRWNDHTNWLQDSDVCKWYGITCYGTSESDDRRIGHIETLDLSDNHLVGSIPSEIYELPYLSTLILRDNPDLEVNFNNIDTAQYLEQLIISSTGVKSLDGVGVATGLKQLHITSLELGGSMPKEIFKLTNLEGLFANFNAFTGTVPTEIGVLTNLVELFMYENDFTGQLPTEIGNLDQLTILALAQNALSGSLPAELDKCTMLNILAIQREATNRKGNGISGKLPSLSSLGQVTEIYFENQMLTGSIPDSFLRNAPEAEVIKVSLSGNQLTGTVPTSLAGLTRLRLDLADNKITLVPPDLCKSIPDWFGGNVADLGCNAFLCPNGTFAPEGRKTSSDDCTSCLSAEFYGSSVCPKNDSQLTEQEILTKFYNDMGGSFWKNDGDWLNPAVDVCSWYGIECDGNSGNVSGIVLKDNDLTGTPSNLIFLLPNLRVINLASNSITFNFKGIGNATKLETLDLTHCDLDSLDDIDELMSTSIKFLKLASNDLKDQIPSTIFKLTSLQELSLSHNAFSGTLPTDVGQLVDLDRFQCYGNTLKGQIPTQISKLVKLTELNIAENHFSGTLPTELNLLTALETLAIHQSTSSSGIGGPLLSFHSLSQLTLLQLNSNKLTGLLPSDLLETTQRGSQRIELQLSDNVFRGTIPAEWADRFDELTVDLTGNQITVIPDTLCKQYDWMGGIVDDFGCSAILCPIGYYNEFGRQTDTVSVCRECTASTTEYLGMKQCVNGEVNPEVAILQQLYFATGGSSWKNSTGWTTSSDPCTGWFGIECNLDGEVSTIDLSGNGLSGVPPTELFQLPSLSELYLESNQIDFSFDGIGQATNLEVLYLSDTDIDTIAGLGKAKSLVELHLTSNDLTGTIPDELFGLVNLRQLFMNYNRFSGRIPSGIASLSNLEELYLMNNGLEGQIPAAIGTLLKLKTLALSENNLSGTLPVELNALTSIEILAIQREGGRVSALLDNGDTGVNQEPSSKAGSGIRGPLPSFDKLENLKQLYLGANSLTGTIPFNFLDGISDKSSPIEVDLISNQLKGEIPASLTQFDNLTIYLADNQITGIAPGLCLQSDWMFGDVGFNECDGILCPPNKFSQFGRHHNNSACADCPQSTAARFYGSFECSNETVQQTLTERDTLALLFVDTDGFDWEVNTNWLSSVESICNWHGITCVSESEESVFSIHLSQNSLNGTIPSLLFNLPNLTEIDFSGNDVHVDFSGIRNATKLEYLNLDNSGQKSLSGIKGAPSLKLLNIEANDFTGGIPPDIYSLSNLEALYMSANAFQGTIPSELGALSRLIFLQCHTCGLSGTVPSWINALSGLQYIGLHRNSLTGTLPSQLSTLTKLKHLDLAEQTLLGGDGINGSLLDFAGMPNLTELYLSRNRLNGTIPTTFLNDVNNTDKVYVDLRSNQLTGSIPTELTHLSNLDILLANNKITVIPDEICQTSWNGGNGNGTNCDFIMCSKGTFNLVGRAVDGLVCNECPENRTQYYGSTECGKSLGKDLLINMFVGLSGAYWIKNDGWLVDDDVCKWYGITCDQERRVQSIVLEDNNLQGTVKGEIFELPDLKVLDLRQNQITITFEAIANAVNLTELYLSETNITSLQGIGKAPSLVELHLTSTNLNGPIPSDISSLTSLERLYMNYNGLSGKLSLDFTKMVNLRELYLFHNGLTGTIPTEIGFLSKIELLALGENKFSGTLPSQLNSLPKLQVLSLQRESMLSESGPGLSGPLLPFDGLPELREMYFEENSLTGTIPSTFLGGISNKTATVQVDLTGNELKGAIPSSLTLFDDLKLFLADNKIEEIPESVCGKGGWMDGELASGCDALLCPPGSFNEYGRRVTDENSCFICAVDETLQYFGSVDCGQATAALDEREILFQLYAATGGSDWKNRDNWLEDDTSICTWFGVRCTSTGGADTVAELQLDSNGLVGTVPPTIFQLPKLRVLNLHDNSVDVSFQGMTMASALEELILDQTEVSSLDGIGKMQNLSLINMETSSFDGLSIPDELFDLTSLTKLYISNAGFVGTLSTKIGKLSNLRELHCHKNDLSGEIPSALGQLQKLEILELSENNFFGNLPTALNQLSSLKTLFLDSLTRSSVGVSGPLLSFSDLPNLRNLYLGSNSLTGTVPENFLAGVDAGATINIGLSDNRLTGTMPASLARFGKLNIDLTGNKIEAIDSALCDMSLWMEGAVGTYDCSAILCRPGTFNQKGRQMDASTPCLQCPGENVSPYYGSKYCLSVEKANEKQVLELFFRLTGGSTWKRNDGWMTDSVDVCQWFGISCRPEGTVESILLGSNNLMGTPPKEIFRLSDLQFLWLYSNPIEFSFEGIEEATRLTSLLLDSTGLSSLKGVGGAASLVDLDVRFNSLKGVLPTEIRDLRELQTFACSDNQLSGVLPTFATNSKLVTLRLGNNDFSGPLPSFSSHPSMKSLDLSDNRLTGSIPSDFLELAHTENTILLDLSSNDLTGTVPVELGRFDDVSIYLRDNKLEFIDPALCAKTSWNKEDVGTFGCDGLLCPIRTYAPDLGRASRDGSDCQPCDVAEYLGSSICGEDSSSTNNPWISSSIVAMVCVVMFILV